MRDKVEELSASGVKKFEDCPKSFWYKYLSDFEPPKSEEPVHFEIGNTVHDTIENVLQRGEVDISNEETLFNAFQSEESTLDYEYDDDDKVKTCFETASRWISSFVVDVCHVEEKWSMERDEIEYRGLADLVADVEQDGEMYKNTIVDWKTGSVNDEWKERIQAGMYIEMFYEKFGEYPEAAVFVYLSEETQSFHPRIRDGEVFWNEKENKYWTEIEKSKNKILRAQVNGEWEAKPEQSRCFFCDYKHHCKDSGIGAEKVEPQHIKIGNIL